MSVTSAFHTARPAAVAARVARASGVLLTDGDRVPRETAIYLEDSPEVERVAIGATAAAAIGEDVASLAGEDDIATALMVADRYWPDGPELVGLVSTTGLTDGIAGGAVVGAWRGPFLLVEPDHLPGRVSEWLRSRADVIEGVVILGGPSAISEEVEAEVAAIIDG